MSCTVSRIRWVEDILDLLSIRLVSCSDGVGEKGDGQLDLLQVSIDEKYT